MLNACRRGWIPVSTFVLAVAVGLVVAQEAKQEPKAQKQPAGKKGLRVPGGNLLAGEDAIPPCSLGHCHIADPQIYTICTGHNPPWGADVHIPTRETAGPNPPVGTLCWCSCSCLARSTKIRIPTGTIPLGDLKDNDKVQVVGEEGGKKVWVTKKVKSHGGSDPSTVEPYAIYVFSKDELLISNGKHLYLLADGKTLKRADRLTLKDKLMGVDFKPMDIIYLANREFPGSLHNFETDGAETSVNEHLIGTNGVISGDFFLQQKFARQDPTLLAEPQIGSPEYQKANPDYAKQPAGFEKDPRLAELPPTRVPPPANAKPFLPPYAEQAQPGMLRPLDDSVSYLKALQLTKLWKGYYPEIDYQVDWNNNTVNAVAWHDGTGRHVTVYGGLIRHSAMRWEGITLVLAHETGHHYGGDPRYSGSDLSCEGQADYWGALQGMRDVYPDEEYLTVILPAIDQIYKLFTGGLVYAIPKDEQQKLFQASLGCTHPPPDCRRDTYNAAVDLKPKPDCASFMEMKGGDPKKDKK